MLPKEKIHDIAMGMTENILGFLGRYMNDEQLQDACGDIYNHIKAGLETVLKEDAKIRKRIEPRR